MTITQVDYCILGVLAQEDMTGYEIRMVFEKTALGNFSSSPGSIYPALKRMLRLKLVAKLKTTSNRSEQYTITDKGMTALREWILKPVTRNDVAKNHDQLLLRIAFIESTDSKKLRDKFLSSYITALQEYIVELEEYHERESSHLPTGGRLAFEHGLEAFRSTLKWMEKVRSTYQSK